MFIRVYPRPFIIVVPPRLPYNVPMIDSDILILGAGPAGSALGILLARAGLSVTLIDAAIHPRHHVGESLLPASMPILHDLGITHDLLAARYQPKTGAASTIPPPTNLPPFRSSLPRPAPPPHTRFCVRISTPSWPAVPAMPDAPCWRALPSNRSTKMPIIPPSRSLMAAPSRARFLADATGRTALIAAKRREKQIIPAYGRLAVYNYFHNLQPHDSLDPALHHHVRFFVTCRRRRRVGGWVWLIPLKDGRTSVGIVVRNPPALDSQSSPPSATAGPNSASSHANISKPESIFCQAAQAMPRLAARLHAATPTDPFRAISDYSFTVQHKFGPVGGRRPPKWIALGDAAGFLDPIFSSGIHLALASAHRAAPAILETLETSSPAPLQAYAAHLDAGFRVFSAFVDRFYNRDLVHNLFFMKNKPPATHRALTQILAGHVWDPANPVLQMLGIAPSAPS